MNSTFYFTPITNLVSQKEENIKHGVYYIHVYFRKVTYTGIQWNDPDCAVAQSHSKKTTPLFSWWYAPQPHAHYISRHVLTLGVFIQLASLKHHQTAFFVTKRICEYSFNPRSLLHPCSLVIPRKVQNRDGISKMFINKLQKMQLKTNNLSARLQLILKGIQQARFFLLKVSTNELHRINHVICDSLLSDKCLESVITYDRVPWQHNVHSHKTWPED